MAIAILAAASSPGRNTGGDGGVDILTTDPDGCDAAIQCKRWALTKPVGIDEVRKLNGALAHEHPGRRGILVTTSRLTKAAEALAAASAIEVVARDDLAKRMAHVRYEVEPRDSKRLTAASAFGQS